MAKDYPPYVPTKLGGYVGNKLYALESNLPISEGREGCVLLSCLPLDFDDNGLPCDVGRYLSLVSVPSSMPTGYVCDLYADARTYTYHWLTYIGGVCCA